MAVKVQLLGMVFHKIILLEDAEFKCTENHSHGDFVLKRHTVRPRSFCAQSLDGIECLVVGFLEAFV